MSPTQSVIIASPVGGSTFPATVTCHPCLAKARATARSAVCVPEMGSLPCNARLTFHGSVQGVLTSRVRGRATGAGSTSSFIAAGAKPAAAASDSIRAGARPFLWPLGLCRPANIIRRHAAGAPRPFCVRFSTCTLSQHTF